MEADEPVFIGILQSLERASSWWRPMVAGVAIDTESILIHWLNAPLVLTLKSLLPLHEAARVANVVWTALGITALFAAARRWSGGHISYLAAIISIGLRWAYDRAAHGPDIPVFAAVALAFTVAPAWRRRLDAPPGACGDRPCLLPAARSWVTWLSRCRSCCCALPRSTPCTRRARACTAVRQRDLCGLACCTRPAGTAWPFAEWIDVDFGLKLEDRDRFGPTFYLEHASLFAWPAWPVAIWLVTLRARGFGGGWRRGEVIAPLVLL